jgi:hypothetical protein
MANETPHLSPAEAQFIAQLRRHPELQERLRALVGVADSGQQSMAQADDIEAQLIELTRQIGQTTLESWATHSEAALAKQFRQEHPQAQLKKKGPDVV